MRGLSTWFILAMLLSAPFFAPAAESACTDPPTGIGHWWTGDNNALDIIGTDDGAPAGDATYVAGGMSNESFSFDGTGDYVSMGASGTGDFQDAPFTVDFWIRIPAAASGQLSAYVLGKSTPNLAVGWDIRYNDENINDGKLSVIGVNGWGANIKGSTALTPDTWHHVALTGTTATGTATLYIDGASAGSSARAFVATASNVFSIGTTDAFGGNDFQGEIDEVRIFDRALSAAEVQAIYNAGGDNCRPCAAEPGGLVSWWRAENNGGDGVGANHGSLENGATFAAGMVRQAFSLDGTDDFVAPANDGTLDFGAGDFSIEAWINPDVTFGLAGNHTVFAKYFGDQGYVLETIDDALRFSVSQGSGLSNTLLTGAVLLPGAWQHVVAVRSGTTNLLYLNGAQAGSTTGATLWDTGSGGTAYIGALNKPGDERFFFGMIDEVRVYNVPLLPDEVAALYNSASTGMCGACAPLPPGLTHWWAADGNPRDLVGVNHATLMNGAGYGDGRVNRAFHLSGSDYVNAGALSLANSTFSFELWARRTTAAGSAVFFGQGINTAHQGLYAGFRDASTLSFDFYSDALDVVVGGDNAWHHYAGTYDLSSGARTLYVDGAPVAADTATAAYQGSGNFGIGLAAFSGLAPFNGEIDEFQLYDRVLTPEEVLAHYSAGAAGLCRDCTPRPANVTHWWRGEGDAADFMGADDGSLANGTSFGPGLVGQAFSFDGIDDRVDFGAGTGDFQDAPYTVEFLIKAPSSELSQTNNYILGRSYPDAGHGWDIRLNDDATADGKIAVSGVNGWAFNIKSTDALAADQWYHVALTGYQGGVTLYIDGTVQGTSSWSAIDYSTNPFRLGMTTNFGGSPFEGLLDEVAIYGRALSAAEVADLANARCAGKCATKDTTPDNYSFTDRTEADPSTIIVSDVVTISGIDWSTPISIFACTSSSCEYRINFGNWQTTAGTVENGDTVQVRQTSSASGLTQTDLTLLIGGVTDAFSVTTTADCGALAFPNADTADCTANSRHNQTCTVSCLAGFSGLPTATCGADGVWVTGGSCDTNPPVVQNWAVKNIGTTGVTITCNVNPRGQNGTTAGVEWGTTTGYGSNKAHTGTLSGGDDVLTDYDLTGLSEGTEYHYRCYADSGGVPGNGGDATFRTSVTGALCTDHWPVSINPDEYAGVQSAADAATNGALVRIHETALTGSVNVSLGAPTDSITFRGGWNCDYSTENTSGFSIIQGAVTLTTGIAEFDRIAVK